MRPSISTTGIWASVSFAAMVALQLVDAALRWPCAWRSTSRLERLVGLGLEVLERQVLELVLHLAHPEAVGDRRVDVEGLLGDPLCAAPRAGG